MNVRPGQNMLELIIATGVILTSVIAAITLIISTITVGRISQNRIEAANFAREGIEVVRQIRDSNWIRRSRNVRDTSTEQNIYQWDFNPLCQTCTLADSQKRLSGDFTLQHANVGGVFDHEWQLLPCGGGCTPINNPIYFDNVQHIYTQANCGQCDRTRYGRMITITPQTETLFTGINTAYLDVTVSVIWSDRTGTKTVVAQERLYDWQQ